MILSGGEITARIEKGELEFNPEIDKFQVQQHSVDLRLGFTFLLPKSWDLTDEGRVAVWTDHLNLNQDHRHNRYQVIELEEGQFFDILPGEFVAVTTLERIHLPGDLMGVLYPRSSVNRRGLSIDLTGIVDAGYEGNLLIPVRNNTQFQVIRMYPGERFCQIVFEEISGSPVLQQSRWHNRDVLVTIQDERSTQEMEYVRSGKITRLKKDFPLREK
jgi:dCTP deaminase